jgi:PPIC-type PPIASE domain
MKKLLREPLLHFTLVAILLFVADHVWNRFKDDRKTITVSALTQKEARETFKAGMNREPSEADMKILVNRWLDNEILYREGISLGLDKGDPSIRERIIFKALSVVQAGLSLPAIKDDELKQWFEKNRERYDVPAKFDFLEAVPTGEEQNIDLQNLVAALNLKGKNSIESSLRVFKQRPRTNLLASYGEEFTKDLEKATPGQWILLTSQAGKHVVQLESIQAGVLADFAQFKIAALKDWREQTLSKMTTDTVRNMGKKFVIQQEGEK